MTPAVQLHGRVAVICASEAWDVTGGKLFANVEVRVRVGSKERQPGGDGMWASKKGRVQRGQP